MENILLKKGKYFCDAIDQLIGVDNKFLINQIKSYCKYLLSLDKDLVNSAWPELYEEVEEYYKEFESYTNKMDSDNMRLKQI